MACGIFQYNMKNDTVYLIEEKIQSKLKLEELANWIKNRPYNIQQYICDISGNQEREQTGKSNIKWFKDNTGIDFKHKTSTINEGVSVVRSYIKSATGKIRFLVSSICKESIDGLKRYKYPEKDGKIQNENPLKEDDDAVDMIRYYFIYKHDPKDKNRKPIQVTHYR